MTNQKAPSLVLFDLEKVFYMKAAQYFRVTD
jgi:hypothetical protein